MEIETWEYDGRCPKCGSENLTGDEDTSFVCECGHKFKVIIKIKDALYY